ncbi:hypothetical protein ACFW9I_35950 [[Kitasatospora] papulosa]|uniref:hypothetical protein n=1 Tax=[Kitasatospora] papulosa TaxID=1464011 RepID=UPI0036C881D1
MSTPNASHPFNLKDDRKIPTTGEYQDLLTAVTLRHTLESQEKLAELETKHATGEFSDRQLIHEYHDLKSNVHGAEYSAAKKFLKEAASKGELHPVTNSPEYQRTLGGFSQYAAMAPASSSQQQTGPSAPKAESRTPNPQISSRRAAR